MTVLTQEEIDALFDIRYTNKSDSSKKSDSQKDTKQRKVQKIFLNYRVVSPDGFTTILALDTCGVNELRTRGWLVCRHKGEVS